MKAIRNFISETKSSWKAVWSSRIFRIQFLFTIIVFSAVAYYCSLYMSIWEPRKGTLLLDPLLHMLPPRDFSVPIFVIIHSALWTSFILNFLTPKEMLKAFQAFSLMLILRTMCIYYIPLEHPMGMIYLQDPFTALFLNNVNVVTKDLFFSGHISTMCLFMYFSPKKFWRTYLMFITPILAGLILWQHVHYTVDIIAAPFFTFASCKLIDILHEKWEYGVDQLEYPDFQYSGN